jgi:hypothetical protein
VTDDGMMVWLFRDAQSDGCTFTGGGTESADWGLRTNGIADRRLTADWETNSGLGTNHSLASRLTSVSWNLSSGNWQLEISYSATTPRECTQQQ